MQKHLAGRLLRSVLSPMRKSSRQGFDYRDGEAKPPLLPRFRDRMPAAGFWQVEYSFTRIRCGGVTEDITLRSQVQIWCLPLVLMVAKSGYRRVIQKAAISGWRPFRVLSPFLTTTSSIAARLKVSVSAKRATSHWHPHVRVPPRSRPQLSVVSTSRLVWVNNRCERSTGCRRHGCER